MAVNPENYFTGDGSQPSFVFTFEYIDEADVKVSLDGAVQATTAYSFANATTILFNTPPADGVEVRIYRDTDVDDLKSTFFAGSSVRAQDLNKNFEQNNFAVQEIKAYSWDNETETIHSDETWVSSDTQIATTAAIDARFFEDEAETIKSGETWVSTDDQIASTAALDARFVDQVNDETIAGIKTFTSSPVIPQTPTANTQAASKGYVDTEINDKINDALTSDIAEAEGINVIDDGDGTITVSIHPGSANQGIGFDRINEEDIIDLDDQDTGTGETDNNIFTALAAARRFDAIVNANNPGNEPNGAGTVWETGKFWYQNDADQTLSIWDGSQWDAIVSGGTFTELEKVVYVDSINGDDSNTGHRISSPKLTIKAAVDQINAETDADGNGSVVVVAPGIYAEEFPIAIEKNDVSIVGTSLRNCIIHPVIGVTQVTAAVNGVQYRIRFVGTTDFTAIGAADNNVGTTFTATGAGTGTGVLENIATQTAYDVNTPEPEELGTMFQLNSGSYLQNLTLMGMKASGTRGAAGSLYEDATYGLPPNQGWNFAFFPGADIKKSPYIQNCTNFSDSQINNVTFTPHAPSEGAAGDLDSAPTGGGILVDGSVPAANSPLRSVVCDSYTHTALDGPGIFVTNNGYCQATSSYAFFNHAHITCLNGGQANLAASTTDFGRYGLIADGKSPNAIFTAAVNGTHADGSITFNIDAPTAATDLYGTPADPKGWFGDEERPQDNMLVEVNSILYPVLSAVTSTTGGTWTVTISRPDQNDLQTNLGINGEVNNTHTAEFFLRSMVASSGHTMEYVGSGTNYSALPENGGVPVNASQKVELDAGTPVNNVTAFGGKVWAAITDHRGNFSVGDTFSVDQQTGFVTIPTSASDAVKKTAVTGSALLPVGTTAQRDSVPAAGMIRYNTSTAGFEGYGSEWGAIGGGATGGGSDAWALEHDNTITTSYTIGTNKNVISAGPLTVNSGATVTVPSGSNWVIV